MMQVAALKLVFVESGKDIAGREDGCVERFITSSKFVMVIMGQPVTRISETKQIRREITDVTVA